MMTAVIKSNSAMQVNVIKIQRFGKYFYYPHCPLTRAICDIANKKSLSERDIQTLKDLESLLRIQESKQG